MVMIITSNGLIYLIIMGVTKEYGICVKPGGGGTEREKGKNGGERGKGKKGWKRRSEKEVEGMMNTHKGRKANR